MKQNLAMLALTVGAALFDGVAAAPAVYSDPGAFALAAGALTTEDFESLPWIADTNYAGSVSSLGITWTAANTVRASTFMPHSGRIALSDVDGSPDLLDTLTAQLPDGTTAFGLWLRSTQNLVNIEFSVYAGDGDPLANFAQTFFDTWSFIGLVADSGLGQLRLRATSNGGIYVDDFIVDDVSFASQLAQPVPEPGSLALVGAALVTLIGLRCRRTR